MGKNMNNLYTKTSQVLNECVFIDSLKENPEKVPGYIRKLQGIVKSHSGSELSGNEAIRKLKKIKTEFPKQWEEVMDDQKKVDEPWLKGL